MHRMRAALANRSMRFLSLAGLLLICALTGAASRAAPVERPNILFILSDDHAAKAMSCYGSRINSTPNLDRLARQGMLFEHAMVVNSLCAPSRAAILTGKYGHRNGVTTISRQPFDGSQNTFPGLLQKAGYRTAIVGKWHLVSDPEGFDYWSILPGQGRYFDPEFLHPGGRKTLTGFVTDIITDLALDWLERRDRETPFCLLVHHKAPHAPVEDFDPRYADRYNGEVPEPPTLLDDYATRIAAPRAGGEYTFLERMVKGDLRKPRPPELRGQELRRWMYQEFIRCYLRQVASLDDNVGRLLDYVDRAGLAQNTLVIYASDNGFFLGDHGWYNKMWMYEESLHIPLLVRYPGKVSAGAVNREIVLNLDFSATLLDAAGLPIPPGMQGRSLLSLLGGSRPADWRSSMYYRYYGQFSVPVQRGVRTRRFKLIEFFDLPGWELYDLAEDPQELNNLSDNPAYATTLSGLKAELARQKALAGDSGP